MGLFSTKLTIHGVVFATIIALLEPAILQLMMGPAHETRAPRPHANVLLLCYVICMTNVLSPLPVICREGHE